MNLNCDNGLSLESYLVGFIHNALNDIAESLADNDVNKAIRKTYEAIECLKQNLRFKNAENGCKEECKTTEGLF